MASARFLVYTLLVLPPILIATTYHLLASFPDPRPWQPTSNSLASLPQECRSWEIYPETYYPGGNYVDLPYGRTRYWLYGPEDGAKVVLIHGLSIPSIIWKHIAPELVHRGMRVLVYDLYGRGYTDAPEPPIQYDTGLYTTQLALLMQHVKWNEGADVLVGLSMGGAIASAFVAHFPDLAGQKVVLLSSAGVLTLDQLSRTTKFMSSTFVQGVLSVNFIRHALQYVSDPKADSPPPVEHEHAEGGLGANVHDVKEIVRLQSAHLPLFNAALASSIRDGPIRGLESVFQSEAWHGRDVLIIHGTDDEIVPYEHTTTFLTQTLKEARLVTIEGGTHDLTLSWPEEILKELDGFLALGL